MIFKNIKDRVSNSLAKIDRLSFIIFTIGYVIVAFFIVLAYRYPIYSDYQIDDIARQNVVSDYSFAYYDRSVVREIIDFIESTKPYYYNQNENFRQNFETRLNNILEILQIENEKDFLNEIRRKNLDFSQTALDYIVQNRFLIGKYENRFHYLYNAIVSSYIVVDRIPERGIERDMVLATRQGNIEYPPSRITLYPLEKEIALDFINRTYPTWRYAFKEAVAEILVNSIEPTAYIDINKRRRIVETELEQSHHQKFIKKGDIILSRGDLIDTETLSKLQSYKEYRRDITSRIIPVYLILSLIVYILIIYRLYAFENRSFKIKRHVMLTVVFFVLSNAFFYISYHLKAGFMLPISLFIPFGIISMSLPDLMRNTRVSIILLVFFSIFFMFYPMFDLISFFALLTISLTTVYTSKLLKNRKDFFPVGAIIGVINLIFAVLYMRIENGGGNYFDWGFLLLFSFGNGLVSAMLSLGMMPIFENMFNIPTKFRLLELANPTTSPLLKRLKVEAPGTYSHSLLIGDMAAEATEELGIDHLLVRVGGYYHDIGKIENPIYFIENQQGANKHDEIKPTISVSIIKNHVKAGVNIAKENRIPEEIIDYIREHHGTTAISYFYHQALGLFGDEQVNIQDYEYPGPKPHTKGAAIIMIADAVEASLRAYSQNNDKLSLKIIQEIVDDAINMRMAQGQFDNCDLNLHEIKTIKEAFIKFLSRYYHRRLEYQKKATE
jgi:hypothetical protein